jgi:RNA polymerase sigma-70 factor, ECF subfamily
MVASGAVLKIVPSPPSDASGQDPALASLLDDDLMKLTGTGVRSAFRELVRRYQGRVLGVCVRAAATPEEGRDLAQEAFVALWQAAPRYRPSGSFPAFLFTIVRNQLRSAARRRGRLARAVRAPETAPDPAGAEPLERLLAAEDERRLRLALAALDEVHRQAILLRFSGGLPYEEIAGLCAAPEGTVRSWVHHGIKRLRRLLGEPS